jgi:hypothetical protein
LSESPSRSLGHEQGRRADRGAPSLTLSLPPSLPLPPDLSLSCSPSLPSFITLSCIHMYMAQQQAHAAPPAQASAERWKYDPVKEKWEPSATVLKEVLPLSRSRSLPPSLSLPISPCPALPPSQVLLLHRVFICTWMDGSYIAHTYVLHACMYLCMFIQTHTYFCVCICVCVYIIYIHVYMYIHIYTYIEKPRTSGL